MDLATCFKTLGDHNRLRIIEILLRSDLCVGALAKLLKLSEPALSQHLKLLREAGLVRGEKRGYWTHYTVEKDALRRLSKEISGMTEIPQLYETVCWKAGTISETSPKRMVKNMCNDCCQSPEKLKGKPSSCRPEQVQKCHGKTADHPGVAKKKKKR